MPKDWLSWHRAYDEDSSQAHRLATIQRWIGEVIGDCQPGPIRILSLCAGDGRDLVGALEHHARRADVDAILIELESALVTEGRRRVIDADLDPRRIQFLQGDAGLPATYTGATPADLILCCGVFGNVPDSDIERTIRALPALATDGAVVIWTRSQGPPDITPEIRGWFTDAGFDEVAFDVPIGSRSAVGVHRLSVLRSVEPPPERLFRFTD